MIETTPDGPRGLQPLADKHGFSLEAVRHMLHALERGHGTMAQFDHPEFGGLGQWFSGGMVMVGRMNDHALKARVASLCTELASSLPKAAWHASAASSSSASTFASGGAFEWWPPGLGRPSSVGAQNTTRYAYFPQTRRLAVETDGRVALYDTGEHVITGASQQQGAGSSFVFTGPAGTVALDALKRVDADERADAESPHAATAPTRPDLRAAEVFTPPVADIIPPAAPPPPAGQTDVLSTLERLAELHRKGVLTDAEFSGKKAELLARL